MYIIGQYLAQNRTSLCYILDLFSKIVYYIYSNIERWDVMNILLVDDEPICISTVSHILNNMYDGEVTLYTAVSASEALDIVKKTKIDLVFTDIRMPNTDGLELTKSILRILPVCEVVILSAYDQKKYLKTAINLNVFRYLQKPINPTEILEVTQLVAAKHETLKTMSAPEKTDFMQRKIIDILISQSYHPQKIKMLSEHILNSDFFSCKYYTVVLVMSNNNDVESEVSGIIQSVISEKNIFTLKTIKNAMVLYILGSREAKPSEAINFYFEKTLSPEIYDNIQICIGNTVENMEYISSSYINACLLAEYSFYTKKGIHLFDEKADYCNTKKWTDTANFNAESIPCYEDGFNAFLDTTYNLLKQNASMPKKSVHILFFNIINHMFIQAKNNGIFCNVSMDDIYYMNFLTIDDLYEFSYNFVADNSLYLPINKMAFNIKNYIKENYHDKNLSIDTIAAHFFMSPQYIPKLFKKAFDISITQYIANTRISAAKTLISTQDIGIKNIAEAVGYDDANYFSRLFKKKTGMTYTEYKKQQNK